MSQNRGVKTRDVSCKWSKAKQLPSCQRNTLHSDPGEYCLFGDAFRRHELHRHHTHVLPLAVPNNISSAMPCSSGVMCHRLHESQLSRPLPRNPPPPPHRIVGAPAEARKCDACPAPIYAHAHELELRVFFFVQGGFGPAADNLPVRKRRTAARPTWTKGTKAREPCCLSFRPAATVSSKWRFYRRIG